MGFKGWIVGQDSWRSNRGEEGHKKIVLWPQDEKVFE
jgi:hypothetical protein